MPRELSLSARTSFNAEHGGEIPIVLVTIEHADLDAPIRLSSDPTERFSLDPLLYGTTSNANQFTFVLMTAILPDDRESPSGVQLAFDNASSDMAAVVRASQTPATITIQLVLASSPDDIEEEYTELQAVAAEYNANRITLDVSREPLTSEPFPQHRMTQNRFPGLFR